MATTTQPSAAAAPSGAAPQPAAALVAATGRRHGGRWIAGGAGALAGAFLVGIIVGPAGLPPGAVLGEVLSHLPLLHIHSHLSASERDIVWQLRMPRVVLGGLVGWILASCGASYQGAFQNPLADPYLLGAAAGAGLGATLMIVYGPATDGSWVDPVPVAAFGGGVVAVAVAYGLGIAADRARGATTVVLAGVAVAAFFTAVQTYFQQQHSESLREVYSWILGRLTTAGWHEVELLIPYAVVSSAVLLLHRRHLDVLRVGDSEATTLGLDVRRTRLVVVLGATLGTAAAVAVSGLIGFVGIIVPHTVRLLTRGGYRLVLPLSMLVGGAFVIIADVLARTVSSPAEVPIGVITAFFGAPFFLLILRRGVHRP